MKKLIALMLVLVLVVSCVSFVACGGGGDDDDTAGEEDTSDVQVTGEEDDEDEDEGTPEDSGETSGSDDLGQMMGFDSYDDLDSYHMHMVMTSEMPMVGETEVIMDEDVDNKKEASHMVMDMGMGTMETITIGDETWTKMYMQDKWTYSSYEADDSDETYEAEDFTDQFDMENDLDYVGKEKVNGVTCKHYKVKSTIMTNNPDPNAMVDEVESNFDGDIWVADEGKLPKVAIRMVGTTTIQTEGMELASDMEIDITNINKSVKISPPPDEDVMKPGEMPDFGDFNMDDFNFEDFELPEGWDNP